MSHVGEFIRKWRYSKGYSQVDLGIMLKYKTGNMIWNIENGFHNRPYEFVKAIRKFLSRVEREGLDTALSRDILEQAQERMK